MLNKGIYAAALTPMDLEYRCNAQILAQHCLDLIKRGCQGVALFGTTGEGASFSVAEKIEALTAVIAEGVNPGKIILANGGSSFPDTVALAKEAAKHSCLAVLVAPPSFYKNVPEEGVTEYFRWVIRRAANPRLKMLLYHIPQYSGVPISLRTIHALREEFPEIVIGLKESEGNLAFTKEILKTFPGFQVFVGNESQIIEAVQAGGSGSICGIANLFPELIVSLYGRKGPNPKEFEEIFAALKKTPFIPSAKAWMAKKKGAIWKIVRPPLMELNSQEKAFII